VRIRWPPRQRPGLAGHLQTRAVPCADPSIHRCRLHLAGQLRVVAPKAVCSAAGHRQAGVRGRDQQGRCGARGWPRFHRKGAGPTATLGPIGEEERRSPTTGTDRRMPVIASRLPPGMARTTTARSAPAGSANRARPVVAERLCRAPRAAAATIGAVALSIRSLQAITPRPGEGEGSPGRRSDRVPRKRSCDQVRMAVEIRPAHQGAANWAAAIEKGAVGNSSPASDRDRGLAGQALARPHAARRFLAT